MLPASEFLAGHEQAAISQPIGGPPEARPDIRLAASPTVSHRGLDEQPARTVVQPAGSADRARTRTRLLAVSIVLTGLIVSVLPAWAEPVAVIPTVAMNVLVFWLTFAMLGAQKVGWRPLLPGSLFAGIGLQVLTLAGAYVVPHVVASSSALYGSLGVVFAIIAWLFLVIASILNVVLYERATGTVTVDIEAPRIPGQVPVEADRGGVVVT